MGFMIGSRAQARINTNAATYTTLVAAQGSTQKIVVLHLHLAVAGDVTVTFYSNLGGVRTAIDGPYTMTTANGLRGINIGDGVVGVLETQAGASLEILLSGAVQTSGNLMWVAG